MRFFIIPNYYPLPYTLRPLPPHPPPHPTFNPPVTRPSHPHHTPPIPFPDSTSGGTMTFRKWVAAFFIVAVSAATADAQVDQGRFTGTVRDQTNAFVAGATVKVKNERTGEERTVLTNQQG